jgi:hypothetical protein
MPPLSVATVGAAAEEDEDEEEANKDVLSPLVPLLLLDELRAAILAAFAAARSFQKVGRNRR